MSGNGLKLSGYCLKLTNKQKRGKTYTSSLSAEGAKAGSKKRKRSTILPIFMVQFFFCVLFFSFCSNLSIWPCRQVVPYWSRCYTPIFDGLVSSRLTTRLSGLAIFILNSKVFGMTIWPTESCHTTPAQGVQDTTPTPQHKWNQKYL